MKSASAYFGSEVEGIYEVARRMKAQGVSTSIISAFTGLTEAEINSLSDE